VGARAAVAVATTMTKIPDLFQVTETTRLPSFGFCLTDNGEKE